MKNIYTIEPKQSYSNKADCIHCTTHNSSISQLSKWKFYSPRYHTLKVLLFSSLTERAGSIRLICSWLCRADLFPPNRKSEFGLLRKEKLSCQPHHFYFLSEKDRLISAISAQLLKGYLFLKKSNCILYLSAGTNFCSFNLFGINWLNPPERRNGAESFTIIENLILLTFNPLLG